MEKINEQKKKIKVAIKSAKTVENAIDLFAQYVDIASSSGNLEITDYLIAEIEHYLEKNKNGLSSEQKALLYYFLGNAWGDGNALLSQQAKNSQPTLYRLKFDQIDEDHHNEKILHSLRSAYNETDFEKLSSIRKCQLLTNLANSLSHIGRTVEAIEFWEKALKIDKNFTMAKGNLAYGISIYMQLLYDQGHQFAFAQRVLSEFDSLKRDETTTNEAWTFFQGEKTKINKIRQRISKEFNWNDFEIKNSEELNYRKWVGENKLFLNSLNDISTQPISLRDPLMLPTLTTSTDTGVKYHGLFNLIKQEFVSARFLLFEGINLGMQHFSDNEVQLYNTLDYTSTSLNIEKVKLAYRTCYSLIDKVSYFLIEYFALPIKQKDSNLSITIAELENHNLLKTNWVLKAISWIDRDINEQSYQKYLDSDTKLLREIRNHLEHKYLKVTDIGDFEGKVHDKNGLSDNLAYYIPRDKFNKKTLKLFKLVRSLIIYMLLAININENQKSKQNTGLVMPMFIDTIDDNWKI